MGDCSMKRFHCINNYYSVTLFICEINVVLRKKIFFQIVKDWHLTMIVVAMCLVVVIIGVAVAIVGDYKAVEVPDIERPISRNVSCNVR